MKLCPKCQSKYPEDANFCPKEECASEQGPQRLIVAEDQPPSRFVPVSRIGGGASGEVWQANDAQTGGAVAYKLVAPGSLTGGPLALERAQRELRQLQRTTSPRIARVVDFGKTADGQLFIASELIAGEPLDQVVARTGPLPLERAKRIATQIGEALLDAQKVGVIHRDLAAKNVLVSGDDEVKLVNFVVARPGTESVHGVPEYMSPEQAEGKLVDQRSNTYSLGAILYLMLTGEPPAKGDSPAATLEAVLRAEVVLPSARRTGLSADVDRVVMKALEKSTSRRPLTLRQFLTDVGALTAGGSAAGAAPAAGRADAGGGFARTMMFAGGPSDVQKLVAAAAASANQASASAVSPQHGAAGGNGVASGTAARLPAMAGAATDPHETTAMGAGVAPHPRHGAAVAATVVSLPAARSSAIPGSAATRGLAEGSRAAAPAPRAEEASHPAPPPSGDQSTEAPAQAVAGSAAAGFRETLWFKKGDVEQMVAEARAKAAAAAAAKAGVLTPLSVETVPLAEESAAPLDERYVDDGTVTAEDRKKFSLGSAGTATTTATAARASQGHIPGERMSDTEMVEELGGRRRIAIIAIVVAVVVAGVAAAALSMRGKSEQGEGSGPATGATTAPNTGAPASEAAPAAAAAAPAAVAGTPPAGETTAAAADKSTGTAAPAPSEDKAVAAKAETPPLETPPARPAASAPKSPKSAPTKKKLAASATKTAAAKKKTKKATASDSASRSSGPRR